MDLKESTSELHSKAEKMEFNQRMFRGELKTEEYLKYLYQQLSIFTVIERNFTRHVDLLRCDKIREDIYELASTDSVQPFKTLSSTIDYITHIENLENPIPHIYLNHLALAYGGQMIKSKVPGSGKMYNFDNIKECILSIRSEQSDDWADEVNIGFQYIINILDELQRNA